MLLLKVACIFFGFKLSVIYYTIGIGSVSYFLVISQFRLFLLIWITYRIPTIGSRTTTKIQKMKCNSNNSYLLNYAWLALQMSEIRLVGTFGAWIESPILSKLGLAFWSALGRSRRKCTPIKTENQRFFFMKIKNLRFLIFFMIQFLLFLWSS